MPTLPSNTFRLFAESPATLNNPLFSSSLRRLQSGVGLGADRLQAQAAVTTNMPKHYPYT